MKLSFHTMLFVILYSVMPCQATVVVNSTSELVNAVNNANSGGDRDIRVADGYYNLDGNYLRIAADDISVRSESGKRGQVILDGSYKTTEIFQIVASNITIAGMTLKKAYYHPVHIMATSDHDVDHVIIRDLHIIDPGQQAIKINQDSAKSHSVINGLIENCLVELTDAGRQEVWTINGSCYTGGIDGHHTINLTVRDNEIRGFWCSGGLSEHGVHLWSFSTGTVVERNLITDCDRGIGFGLGTSGHINGIIRNNMIWHGADHNYSDVGIGLESAPGAQVYNNTIYHEHPYPNAIEYRFTDSSGIAISNNLCNRAITSRDGATASLSSNYTGAQATWFVDTAAGDLHLAYPVGDVVDHGIALNGLADDFDREPRPQGMGFDIGADEYTSHKQHGNSMPWLFLLF
jgi:hypothetical protein